MKPTAHIDGLFTVAEAARYLGVKKSLIINNMTGAGLAQKTLFFDAEVSDYGPSGKCVRGRFLKATLDRWQAERHKAPPRRRRRNRPRGVRFMLFVPDDPEGAWQLVHPVRGKQIIAAALYAKWQAGRLPLVRRCSPSEFETVRWPTLDEPITLKHLDSEVEVVMGEREGLTGFLVYVAPGDNDSRACVVYFPTLRAAFTHTASDLRIRIPGHMEAFCVPKLFV